MGKVLRFLRPEPDPAPEPPAPPSPDLEPRPAAATEIAGPVPSSPFPVVPEGWPVLQVEAYPVDVTEVDEREGFATFRGYAVNHPRVGPQFWPGTIECRIAGTSHRLGALGHARLAKGQEVLLKREPQNREDPNAVQVFDCDGERHIGYLPRDVAETVASWAGPRGLLLGLWVKNGERVGGRLLIANEPLRLKVVERPPGEAELVDAATRDLGDGVTIEEWASTWLKGRQHSERVVQDDLRILSRYVFPILGGQRLAELSTQDCERWVESVSSAPKSPRHRAARLLAQFLWAAHERGHCAGADVWGVVRIDRQ
jgi:hypothetical protein